MAILLDGPIMDQAPTPIFEEPWHAQVFALTVALNEAGVFHWPDWASRFGATLAHHGHARDLNGRSDYFHAWVETLETFLDEREIAPPQELAVLKSKWAAAYLRTPHGEPVKL